MRMFVGVLALLCSSAATPVVLAQNPDAEKKLQQAAAQLYTGTQLETLPNGLRIYLKPIPGDPIVSVLTGYLVGSADEELDQTGLSHYLEHLMFKGTEQFLPGDIDRKTIRNGGRNNAYTGEDLTVYHFDFAADRWKAGLEIEADRMRNLRIDAKHEFEQEKGAVISELEGGEDEPWDLERKAILPLLFGPNHPYGHPVIGSRNHVKDATASIIKSHYDRWYHPNNAVIVMAGGFKPEEALKTIRDLFGPIPAGKLPERKSAPALPKRKKLVREKIQTPFSTYKLLLGFNSVELTNAELPVMDVIDTILTGGKTSRLHQLLVEKKESCFEVKSIHMVGRLPGYLTIEAELTGDNVKQVEKQILKEIKALAEDGATAEELQRVKRQFLSAHLYLAEDTHELADTIMNHVIIDPNLDRLHAYLPGVLQVTTDDIKRVAKKYLVDRPPVSVWSEPSIVMEEEAKPTTQTATIDNKFKTGFHHSIRQYRQAKEPANATISLQQTKRVVLPNGLVLLFHVNPRVPTATIGALFPGARWREPMERAGVARLVGDMLDAGTTTKTEKQIARQLADRGSSMRLSASGGTLRLLAPDMEESLELLLDCLRNPSFPADRLRQRKEFILAELEEEADKPSLQARTEFARLIFGDKHPLGRSDSGNIEVMTELTIEDCQQFHQDLFVPNNLMLAFSGDINPDQITKWMEKKTADWKAKELPPIALHPLPEFKKRQEKIMTDLQSKQVYVYVGHTGIRRKDPDYFKLLVLDHVFGTGSGLTDRLSSNLRDRLGLAYSVSATITGNTGVGEQLGAFSGEIGTFPDKYIAVRDGILKEMERIQKESPTDAEVQDAKEFLLGSVAFRLSDNTSIVQELLNIERHQLGFDYFERYRQEIAAVTTADVFAMAKKYLKPNQMLILATGPIDESGKPIAPEMKSK